MAPNGLLYRPRYIDDVEATRLLEAVDASPWLTELSRRVQHYGWRYNYRSRAVDADSFLGALPDWAGLLAARLVDEQIFERSPEQLIVNEYLPGQGISMHIDAPHFGEVVVSISLGGTCTMDFDEPETGRREALRLESGSLLVLTSDARSLWRHGIAKRKSDVVDGRSVPRTRRVSLTFRTLAGR